MAKIMFIHVLFGLFMEYCNTLLSRLYTTVYLHKIMRNQLFKNRIHLMAANVYEGWRSSILIPDGWAFTVGTPEINGYLIGTPSVVPVRR